jgi:methylphosphotriester-DNA--protein-cysteine methyltransferase
MLQWLIDCNPVVASRAKDPALDKTATAAQVVVRQPAAALQPYLTFYYFVTASGPMTDFLYPEWGNVRFVLDGDWQATVDGGTDTPARSRLYGHTDRCGRVVTNGGQAAGFGLTPLGWHRMIGTDASALANRAIALGNAFGAATPALYAALAIKDLAAAVTSADTMLLAYASNRPADDQTVVTLCRILHNRPHDVVAFAATAGVSLRTLHRTCLRVFGFPPKRLLRRQRFLDTLGHVRTAVGDPLRDTLDPDYCDLAHFYRDFRDFMGMSPRAYFSASRAIMANAAAAQTAAGVTLSFKLPDVV